jgi:hypothetical protein
MRGKNVIPMMATRGTTIDGQPKRRFTHSNSIPQNLRPILKALE